MPSPMHLRLGQKEKAWTGEYVEDDEEEEEDGVVGRVKEMGDDKENNLDGEDEVEFEGKDWGNNDEDDEEGEDEEEEDEEEEDDELEDGDQAELEWEIPDFPTQSAQHQHHGPPQEADEGDAVPQDVVSEAAARDLLRSHLNRSRAMQRLRRWRRLRSHGGLGFRLTKHWKSWRQRAQWVCSQGYRYSRRAQRSHHYGKQRRIKRFLQSPYSEEEEEEDSNDGRFTESERGTATQR